jgi:aspartyl-tRNA synthetase
MPGGASQPRRTLDAWQEWAKQRGAKGLAYVLVGEDGTLTGPVAKNITDAEREGLAKAAGANPGDCIFFGAGEPPAARALLGAARGEIARRLDLIPEGSWSFVWVVDAPLFERAGAGDDIAVGSGTWTAVHHAFTSPTPEWIDRFEDDPEHALAYAYDLIVNGNELGGGSFRIHEPEIQAQVFQLLGLSEEDQRSKFGFLLDALAMGAPPMGGIALGIDRMTMVLAGEPNLRDVIAFPKNQAGVDPMSGAPSEVTQEQLDELGIRVLEQPA